MEQKVIEVSQKLDEEETIMAENINFSVMWVREITSHHLLQPNVELPGKGQSR